MLRHNPLHEAWLLAATALLLFPVSALAAGSSGTSHDDSVYASKGRVSYAQLCVSCHGPAGKGDGPAGPLLKTQPGDLTSLSRKYHGFPTMRVMTWIDGEKASALGARDMPVWGRKFRRVGGGRAAALMEVLALTKYLQSIQEK